MEGFAQNATRQVKTGATTETVMNGFKPELVPVYRELVKEFAGLSNSTEPALRALYDVAWIDHAGREETNCGFASELPRNIGDGVDGRRMV
ncbi:hypothetical protein SESBI_10736 [Sesbania bispinosa]|nr:hypothetical protein SESBI_10736 [Sesbania bispinosa]